MDHGAFGCIPCRLLLPCATVSCGPHPSITTIPQSPLSPVSLHMLRNTAPAAVREKQAAGHGALCPRQPLTALPIQFLS